MNNILEIKNLSKIYKGSSRGVSDISFSVKEGDFHAFIGQNGAGKTTTIKSIIGSYLNYEGEILINGISSKEPQSKDFLGYVPENAIFPPELTTEKYLLYLASLSGVSNQKAKEKIIGFLEKFKIADLKNEKPINFSSGQKKKVLLIQALLHDPKIIILDEPAANLDPLARYELFSTLLELKKEGKTIFISSHVLSEIDKFADSLTLIDSGKILYSGIKEKSLEDIFYEKVIAK
ncbi:ABC transporter ATP-binding protein [Mycoplasmopsis gallinacea]|uniref:ATP-binding cassette domain-containing protein n=1 Tax=Mycoplasmopsis gallinacea TaxID=29556 RepID=A0A6H0V4S7_9BACT|nr:ABC transporter ATP-binding protein [Mycoplasmopsis gallinacea]QIW62027.1 ATP-binding cassette domain-containing protein [Mycoplasmopsis gallinacea]